MSAQLIIGSSLLIVAALIGWLLSRMETTTVIDGETVSTFPEEKKSFNLLYALFFLSVSAGFWVLSVPPFG